MRDHKAMAEAQRRYDNQQEPERPEPTLRDQWERVQEDIQYLENSIRALQRKANELAVQMLEEEE